ncbi:MAG TPA: 16S rRNA (cytidine(1402)-2'-O)-methyltransferase [Polyangiales bacterium]|nr:16S rRNA (cytidine(1402)-2'-O)-methyltransferase [Polyangiales bacterium]
MAGERAPGLLSIVATPIGNLEDITLRALTTLRAADVVLAEDTRRSRALLGHHGIRAQLRALHAHSKPSEIDRCLAELAEGKRLALITDAGTPLVSDPGAVLAQRAAAAGTRLETIPGPSAVTAALAVAGVPFDRFRFIGFAPRSGPERRAWLALIAQDAGASVFFESPVRIGKTLAELVPLLAPERTLAVCRELTKLHEEVVRGTTAELAERYAEGARGEITVVVGAGELLAETPAADAPSLDDRIRALLAVGETPRDVARALARELNLSRREVYARVQTLVGA